MFLHSSPEQELKINKQGLFGSFIFFVSGECASDAYQMSSASSNIFAIDENNVNLIEATSIFYQEEATKENVALWGVVEEVMGRFSVDEDLAMALIDETANLLNECVDCRAEDSWWLQHATARAAKALGFDGVQVTDEQGASYMIDMFGRETELVKL